jgi:hypothetical protein
MLLLVGACFAQPTVVLSKSAGPPSTKLLLSGSGFDPNAAVDVFFDTKDLALVETDSTGSFGQIGIQVTGSAKPGGHRVSAVERYNGLSGQARFLVETNWAEFHFSPSHSGFNPYENMLSRANVGRLGLRWSHTTGGFVESSPAVANGVVYVGSDDNNVYALNASTDALLWKYATGSAQIADPAVANGVTYFGSWDTNVFTLDVFSLIGDDNKTSPQPPDPHTLVPLRLPRH